MKDWAARVSEIVNYPAVADRSALIRQTRPSDNELATERTRFRGTAGRV